MAPTAMPRAGMREKSTSATPSSSSTQPRNHTRPRSPPRRAKVSEKMPPRVRAKMFITPNNPAMRPAVPTLSSKRSWKYSAATLLMVSSMPKHAA